MTRIYLGTQKYQKYQKVFWGTQILQMTQIYLGTQKYSCSLIDVSRRGSGDSRSREEDYRSSSFQR